MPTKTEFRELLPLNYIVESVQNGILLLRGIYQQADEKNANKRIYPRSLWEKVLNSPTVLEKIAKRGMYGELEHPTDGVTKFPRVSHIVTELKWGENGAILGASEVLPTPNGEILRVLAERKTLIGVSSRGFGFSDFDGDADAEMVRDDFDLDTFDFVCAPSTYNAYATPSYESRYNNGKDMLGKLMCVAHTIFSIREFPLHESVRDKLLQELSIIRSNDMTLHRVCDAMESMIQEARMGNKMISVPTLKKARLRKNEQEELDDKYADELPENEQDPEEDDLEKQLPEDEQDPDSKGDEQDSEKQLPEDEQDPDTSNDDQSNPEIQLPEDAQDPNTNDEDDPEKQLPESKKQVEALKRKIVALKKENIKLRESNRKLAVRYEGALSLVAGIMERVETDRRNKMIDEAIKENPQITSFRETLVKIPNSKDLAEFLESIKKQLQKTAVPTDLPGPNAGNGMTFHDLSESASNQFADDPEINFTNNMLETLGWE